MELTGTILSIGAPIQVTEKFVKRELVIEYKESARSLYSETILFEAHQDRCDLLDAWKVGEVCKVHFNVKGRASTIDNKTRVFNTLQAWRFERVAQ